MAGGDASAILGNLPNRGSDEQSEMIVEHTDNHYSEEEQAGLALLTC